jgi:cell division protein ZapD
MTTSSGTSLASSKLTPDNAGTRHAPAQTTPRLAPEKILYEQPLNERIRSFLRLEYLFQQAAYHLSRQSEWDSRATLTCVLEILELFGNTNLKSEVLKELERHTTSLKRHEQNPDIDHAQLSGLIDSIHTHIENVRPINGQIANELKASEFLVSIRQRSAIPGGTCDFDLPAYHYWLQQPAKQRTRDLAKWLNHFDAIGQAIQMILGLTRDSTPMKKTLASAGSYQRTLDPNLPCQLVRIALPPGLPYFAELSGGRHRFTVRFLQFSTDEKRAKQTDQDVEFELACCVI